MASTPTMGPGVEEYDRLVGGKPVASVTLAGQTLDCLLDSGSRVSFVTGIFQASHRAPGTRTAFSPQLADYSGG